MPRRPPLLLRATLGVLLAWLCLGAAAAGAAPIGALAAAPGAAGAITLVAAVSWDLCPTVCDWKLNVAPVDDPARCPQHELLNVPEGVPYSPGLPGARGEGPFAANGTRTIAVADYYYPPRTYYLCLSAVGLEARAAGQYSPSEACPDPASGPYANAPAALIRDRCPRLYPIATLALAPGQQRPMPGWDAIFAAGRLTLAEARSALRSRRIRGAVRLRRASSQVVRAVVRTAAGTRRYRIAKADGAIRVRRTG